MESSTYFVQLLVLLQKLHFAVSVPLISRSQV